MPTVDATTQPSNATAAAPSTQPAETAMDDDDRDMDGPGAIKPVTGTEQASTDEDSAPIPPKNASRALLTQTADSVTLSKFTFGSRVGKQLDTFRPVVGRGPLHYTEIPTHHAFSARYRPRLY